MTVYHPLLLLSSFHKLIRKPKFILTIFLITSNTPFKFSCSYIPYYIHPSHFDKTSYCISPLHKLNSFLSRFFNPHLIRLSHIGIPIRQSSILRDCLNHFWNSFYSFPLFWNISPKPLLLSLYKWKLLPVRTKFAIV